MKMLTDKELITPLSPPTADDRAIDVAVKKCERFRYSGLMRKALSDCIKKNYRPVAK